MNRRVINDLIQWIAGGLIGIIVGLIVLHLMGRPVFGATIYTPHNGGHYVTEIPVGPDTVREDILTARLVYTPRDSMAQAYLDERGLAEVVSTPSTLSSHEWQVGPIWGVTRYGTQTYTKDGSHFAEILFRGPLTFFPGWNSGVWDVNLEWAPATSLPETAIYNSRWVPEPSTLFLLAIPAGLYLLRRRRTMKALPALLVLALAAPATAASTNPDLSYLYDLSRPGALTGVIQGSLGRWDFEVDEFWFEYKYGVGALENEVLGWHIGEAIIGDVGTINDLVWFEDVRAEFKAPDVTGFATLGIRPGTDFSFAVFGPQEITVTGTYHRLDYSEPFTFIHRQRYSTPSFGNGLVDFENLPTFAPARAEYRRSVTFDIGSDWVFADGNNITLAWIGPAAWSDVGVTVPEPSSYAMLVIAAAGLWGAMLWRKRGA